MSTLRKMIEKFSPNGVEYQTIKMLLDKKVVITVTPSFKVKKADYQKTGNTPIVSQEEEYISGFCDLVDSNISQRKYVCFGDHSEHIKYIDFPFVQGADGLKIMYTNESVLLPRYFYHAISCFYKKHNNYERHFKYLAETRIPLPPLEVQIEIIRLLDNLMELTEQLTAELNAELTARKQQYEYYRDMLLTFEEADKHGETNHSSSN